MKHLPDAALDDRLGFVGTAGSGKSYNAMGRVERLLATSARVACIDPLGVFWGLRLKPDGKTDSGFNIPIFGGPHGDLPLTEHSGALIGETVAGMAESCIIDLSEIGTKAGERRFMLHFLTALYRKASGEPLHLIIDEADMFAPQKLTDKDGEAAKLLGMMETVVRRGRIKGFIPWLITQRPAVIAKDVLSQVDGLVAFKLTSSQDRDALAAWVEGSADKGEWNEIYKSLPGMERGQGLVWIPGRGIMETVRFPEKITFDSSRTPKRGEKKSTATLRPLDLGRLKERLATVDAETKANDPRALRAEIVKLRQDLTKVPAPGQDAATARAAEEAAYQRGERETAPVWFRRGVEAAFEATASQIKAFDLPSFVQEQLKQWEQVGAISPPKPVNVVVPARRVIDAKTGSDITGQPHVRMLPPTRPWGQQNGLERRRAPEASLPKGERACLIAAAQHPNGVTRQQLTVLTGYKRSSRDAYIQRLRERGYLHTDSGDRIRPTAEGVISLGDDFEPLPTGAALREHVLRTLPEGERAVLAVLIAAWPNEVARDDIDTATGYKRSSRDAYLQRLSARELVAATGGRASAAPTLFD